MKLRNNLRSIIALSLIPAIGAQRIKQLLKLAENAENIFTKSRHELLGVHGIGTGTADRIIAFKDWDRVDRILEKSHKTGLELITFEDDDYPGRLRHIYDPPVLLWCRGNRKSLNLDGFAVVGTRNPSHYGRQMAIKFTDDLIGHGFSIISGLAYGIDSIAHKKAVERGSVTTAVLGSGLDRVYPTENIPLAHSIVENGGAVISEYPLGTKPDAGNFPVRNRIVSGMSFGTLVVETAEEGGSMITANLALDQNREVFVIPHPLNSPKGTGCNTLIRTGSGKLVQSVNDIIEELPFRLTEKTVKNTVKQQWQSAELNESQKKICAVLDEYDTLHIDQITRMTRIPINQLLGILLELELKDCVKSIAGKQYQSR